MAQIYRAVAAAAAIAIATQTFIIITKYGRNWEECKRKIPTSFKLDRIANVFSTWRCKGNMQWRWLILPSQSNVEKKMNSKLYNTE